MNNLGGWRDRPPPSLAFFLFLDCHLLLSPPLCIVSLPLLWVTGSGLAGSYPPLQPRQPRSFKNFPIETSTYRRGTSKTDFTASLPLPPCILLHTTVQHSFFRWCSMTCYEDRPASSPILPPSSVSRPRPPPGPPLPLPRNSGRHCPLSMIPSRGEELQTSPLFRSERTPPLLLYSGKGGALSALFTPHAGPILQSSETIVAAAEVQGEKKREESIYHSRAAAGVRGGKGMGSLHAS